MDNGIENRIGNGSGNEPGISLIDRTSSSQPDNPQSRDPSRRFTRRWNRNRKYAKWQAPKSGVDTSSSQSVTQTQTETSEPDGTQVKGKNGGGKTPRGGSSQDTDTMDFATSEQGESNGNGSGNGTEINDKKTNKPDQTIRELDILYENQRGWFLFGIPLYSHGSLLNFDPSAWVTRDLNDSPVNITNAQLPDPSWEWVWHTWYVDMSGDVDEQGWRYSWSFSSTAWHGTHPWFHSFVRRRRWVRMRSKAIDRGVNGVRSGFEKAHMLNEDYFTIHSCRERSIADAAARTSKLSSNYLSRASTLVDEEVAGFEEIADIPTLMYAFKVAIVDREKMEALKRFIHDGGEELYYLDEKIPEIMALFVFQTSRWQFVTYLTDVIDELSQRLSESDKIQRKHDNLAKAAETARLHIRGPDIFGDGNRAAVTGMLELSPLSKEAGLMSKHIWRPVTDMDRGGLIKGIPKAAEIGREGHIY